MTLFGEVRKASSLLAVSSLEERREALASISKLLEEEKDRIKAENDKDLENAEKEGISSSILHRLVFSPDKLKSVEKGYRDLCSLSDPIGKIREKMNTHRFDITLLCLITWADKACIIWIGFVPIPFP